MTVLETHITIKIFSLYPPGELNNLELRTFLICLKRLHHLLGPVLRLSLYFSFVVVFLQFRNICAKLDPLAPLPKLKVADFLVYH